MKILIWLLLGGVSIAVIIGAFVLWTPDLSRDALAVKYLRAPADMIEIGDVRLHVRDDAAREPAAVATLPIIFIHGFGAHLQTWEAWAQALGRTHRVIRYDLPGAGLSPPDPTNDYTDDRALEILTRLMDKLGLAKAHLIGNSIGGRIAWKFAAAHPDRTGKLVLVAPDGFASAGFEYGKEPNIPAIMSALPFVLPKSMLRANLAVAYADPARLSDATLQRYHDLMRAPGSRTALLARMAQTVLEPPEPKLQTITAPVLLVWGDQDQMIPITNSADYLRVLPNARVAKFPSLGHVPMEEDPAVSLPPVERFLFAD